MLIEHILKKDMIKAKETLHEQMMLHVSRLMLEMKKDIAARLSESTETVVKSPKHTIVHVGRNYTAHVLNGNTVRIHDKRKNEHYLVKSPPITPMFNGKPAANDPRKGHDKTHGHYTSMMPFIHNAQQMADGNTENLIPLSDHDVHKLLISAVETHKIPAPEISEGTVVGFPKINKTYNTENHIIHAMDSGEIMVHNKETGKTYKTDAVNGDTFTRRLGSREVTEDDVAKLKKMTRNTVKSMN